MVAGSGSPSLPKYLSVSLLASFMHLLFVAAPGDTEPLLFSGPSIPFLSTYRLPDVPPCIWGECMHPACVAGPS